MRVLRKTAAAAAVDAQQQMSQGHSSFPPRAGLSTKIPDRAASSLHGQPQQAFGQSAPTFQRRTDSSQAASYGGAYSNALAPANTQQQYGTAAQSGFRPYPEKDSNILHELSDEQRAEITEAVSVFPRAKTTFRVSQLTSPLNSFPSSMSTKIAISTTTNCALPSAHSDSPSPNKRLSRSSTVTARRNLVLNG